MRRAMKSMLAVAILVCCNMGLVHAQEMPPVPVDPDVRIGKLENGLTYYIRRNNLPENRADFYLAMKAGAILEEPEQRGLAHFLEHMSFNGTTHFPGDALKQYLESIGVRFGENLNAGTGIEETVYNITNVPMVREGVIDSCLLILHDWSNDLLLDEKEIDKERGVINEEWRTRMNAIQRFQEKALPQMYPGTKYADCLPIGSMDVVMNFKPQVLRDYYEKWYRPDLQAVVVVGDIDVDAIEGKIKTLFADIPAQPNAAERVYYPVSDNDEPIIVIEPDKEHTNIQMIYFSKHDAMPNEMKNNMGYMVVEYMKNMISSMLSTRLNELTQVADPPYIFASAYDDAFFASRTKDAFTGFVVCKEDAIETGFSTLVREIERARRFGFIESEYNRARAEYLSALESDYLERDKKKNEYYIPQYVDHYLMNEPIPGIENTYTLMNQIAPNIPVEALNQLLPQLIAENNKVVALLGPEKEGLVYPSKESIQAILEEVSKEDLTAYVDKVSDEELIENKPVPGKIVSETFDNTFDATVLTLSNGAKVIIKKTDFKADEIKMKGVSLGGTSLFPDSEAENVMTLNSVAAVGGLGNFSTVDLQKVLAGKRAWVSASVGNKTETVNGSCAPKDFETMMQLTYLTFTAPRKDMEAYESYKNRTKASLLSQELNPMVAFGDSVNYAVYMGHPRARRLKSADLDKIDYDKILSMYNDRYMDAGDFTFILIGNVELEAAKPYIEQYLASLPATGRKETFADNKLDMRKGLYKNEFTKEQETTKASVYVMYNGSCTYNSRNIILMSMVSQILDLVYTEKVREDEGGTYGVYTGGQLSKHPKEEFTLEIIFDTDPGKKAKLMDIIYAEIDVLAKEGPSDVNLNKVKEYMLKKHSEEVKENGYWLGVIDEFLYTGTDISKGYDQIVNSITIEDVRDFVSGLISQGNNIEVTMKTPE